MCLKWILKNIQHIIYRHEKRAIKNKTNKYCEKKKKTFERRIVYNAKITLINLSQQQVKMTNKVLL